MSTWEYLQKRLNPKPITKTASFVSTTMSNDFTEAYIKTAEAFDITPEEAVEQLKVLENAYISRKGN